MKGSDLSWKDWARELEGSKGEAPPLGTPFPYTPARHSVTATALAEDARPGHGGEPALVGLHGLALVEVVILLHSQKVLELGFLLTWVLAAVTLSLDGHKGRARLPTGLKQLTGALT